ncbi:MAG UNVERIFIED_CONTAM: hypothetical protein LVT10_04450 [Anaerolineae bacterium]|jgi:hypothetical protein
MNQTITELILTTTVVLPYSGLCELIAHTTEGAGYFELFYDDEWVAYFRVGQDGRLETLADEQEGKQHVTYPSLPPTARLPLSPAFPLAHFRLCLRGATVWMSAWMKRAFPSACPKALVSPTLAPRWLALGDHRLDRE